MKKLLLALLLLFATPAHALHITGSPGGIIEQFIQQYRGIAATGERVAIDGPCYSACTLVTMLRSDQVCITPRAVLGFHSSYVGNHIYSREGTVLMTQYFPPVIRRMLRSRGWDGISPHPGLVSIGYRSLRSIYRDCR